MKKEIKSSTIKLRVTDTDKQTIDKAVVKMNKTTGAKPTVSRVIREALKQYLEKK